jgi:hypothetical protein
MPWSGGPSPRTIILLTAESTPYILLVDFVLRKITNPPSIQLIRKSPLSSQLAVARVTGQLTAPFYVPLPPVLVLRTHHTNLLRNYLTRRRTVESWVELSNWFNGKFQAVFRRLARSSNPLQEASMLMFFRLKCTIRRRVDNRLFQLWEELVSIASAIVLAESEDEPVWQFNYVGVYSSQSLYGVIKFRGVVPVFVPACLFFLAYAITFSLYLFTWNIDGNGLIGTYL